MFNTVVMLWEKKLKKSCDFVLPRIIFHMMANGECKFLFFFSSVNYRRIYSIHLKNSRFAKDVLLYLKNEVIS